ncbi:MAG: AI-2E family transporter [Ruminococcaceae bacterium]|nr:AI-2E family transporter [Oscillospiraceae bacterium]
MSNKKIWIITIFMIVIGALFIAVAPAFPPFIIAAFLAFILNPAVKYFEKILKVKKWLAILIVFVLLIGVLTLSVVLLVPIISTEINAFLDSVPELTQRATVFATDVKTFLAEKNVPDYIVNAIDGISVTLLDEVAKFLTKLLGLLMGWISQIFDIIVIGVSLVYFLADGEKIITRIFNRIPQKYSDIGRKFFYDAINRMKAYLKTQVIISLLTGLIIGIALAILGVKYVLILALLTFVLNFIPYFGSIIAGVISALVPLLTGQGWILALITALTCLIIQQFTGNILTPKLQAKSSGLHPITVLFSVIACNLLFGTVGMFFAVPIAGVVKVVLTDSMEIIGKIE